MTEPVRERLHFTVSQRAVVGEQRRPVSPSLADARVQQPVGDVEAFRDLVDHVKG